jgi:hypothetical protein
MEQHDLSALDHQEQEIDEEGLSKVTGGFSVRNIIATRQQYGKAFATLIGAGTVTALIPAPGKKPIWKQ